MIGTSLFLIPCVSVCLYVVPLWYGQGLVCSELLGPGPFHMVFDPSWWSKNLWKCRGLWGRCIFIPERNHISVPWTQKVFQLRLVLLGLPSSAFLWGVCGCSGLVHQFSTGLGIATSFSSTVFFCFFLGFWTVVQESLGFTKLIVVLIIISIIVWPQFTGTLSHFWVHVTQIWLFVSDAPSVYWWGGVYEVWVVCPDSVHSSLYLGQLY